MGVLSGHATLDVTPLTKLWFPLRLEQSVLAQGREPEVASLRGRFSRRGRLVGGLWRAPRASTALSPSLWLLVTLKMIHELHFRCIGCPAVTGLRSFSPTCRSDLASCQLRWPRIRPCCAVYGWIVCACPRGFSPGRAGPGG